MKKFLVSVLAETSPGIRYWAVSASTPVDAQQLAFALDGGWGKDRDASAMLALSQSYCEVLHEFPAGMNIEGIGTAVRESEETTPMRNMAFSLTKQQCRDKTKDVTRRLGWADLKPGECVQQIEKGQGLKKGEHVVKIHVVECVSNTPEPLKAIHKYPANEVAREGFPDMTPEAFVLMFCKHNHCTRRKKINRIEFKYV